jgi:hypothetical protein
MDLYLPLMTGMPRQWWRLGGLAAILFVAVFVVGVALQDAPPLVDDPVDEIRRDWVEGGQQYLVAGYVLGLGFVLFYIPFMLVLRSLLGRAEGGIELWSRASLVGAFTTLLWGIWSGMFWGALAFGDFAATASDRQRFRRRLPARLPRLRALDPPRRRRDGHAARSRWHPDSAELHGGPPRGRPRACCCPRAHEAGRS